MARKPLVAGNWKMHKTIGETMALFEALEPLVADLSGVEVVICPPFTAVAAAAARARNSPIEIGAQNVHWAESGPFTAEISPRMLEGLCRYVVVGHSERRRYFGETDVTVHKRVQAALKVGLEPIVCVGEMIGERRSGRTASVLGQQVRAALSGLAPQALPNVVIAYEPVWAIGTGMAASVEDARSAIEETIRPTLAELFGEQIEGEVRVLYGGSIKPDNAAQFFELPSIDGGLVGGASLRAADFAAIVRAASHSEEK